MFRPRKQYDPHKNINKNMICDGNLVSLFQKYRCFCTKVLQSCWHLASSCQGLLDFLGHIKPAIIILVFCSPGDIVWALFFLGSVRNEHWQQQQQQRNYLRRATTREKMLDEAFSHHGATMQAGGLCWGVMELLKRSMCVYVHSLWPTWSFWITINRLMGSCRA